MLVAGVATQSGQVLHDGVERLLVICSQKTHTKKKKNERNKQTQLKFYFIKMSHEISVHMEAFLTIRFDDCHAVKAAACVASDHTYEATPGLLLPVLAPSVEFPLVGKFQWLFANLFIFFF